MRQAGNFLTLHPTLARAFALTSAAACLAAAEPALAAVADASTVTTVEPATTTATTTATVTATADAPPPAVYGLFPLWEHTGIVEESGAARVGLRHTQVGLGPLTVGTDPYLDLHGTTNDGQAGAHARRTAAPRAAGVVAACRRPPRRAVSATCTRARSRTRTRR
jgi:hypothetical protein